MYWEIVQHIYCGPFLRLHLCQAGLRTLQDLGPEIRLAMNADLEDDEDVEDLEDEQEEYEVSKRKLMDI